MPFLLCFLDWLVQPPFFGGEKFPPKIQKPAWKKGCSFAGQYGWSYHYLSFQCSLRPAVNVGCDFSFSHCMTHAPFLPLQSYTAQKCCSRDYFFIH